MSKVYKYVITHKNCPITYIKNLCNRFTFKALNRYNLTLKELCYRLKHKIKLNKKFKCKYCGKDIKFNVKCGYTKHCSIKCAQESRKLNVSNILQKMKDTNLKRYGVDNAMKNSIILNKVKRTCIMKYGAENPMQNIDVQNSLKFSLISKYGVDNISKTKYWKNLIHNNKDLIQQKRYNTCKKNNSFNISKLQSIVFDELKKKFNIVLSEYKSKLYPFKCDFYIKDIDTYIECNFHWMHGREPYDYNNTQHNNILNFWKYKLNEALKNGNKLSQYAHAIDIWTVKDPLKLNTFKKNKLKYKIFYTIDDFYKWYSTINP